MYIFLAYKNVVLFLPYKVIILVFPSCLCIRLKEGHCIFWQTWSGLHQWPSAATKVFLCSTIRFEWPSLSTKAVTKAGLHLWGPDTFLMAEFECSVSTLTFSRIILFTWETPPKGLALEAVPKQTSLYCWSYHVWFHWWWNIGASWQYHYACLSELSREAILTSFKRIFKDIIRKIQEVW